MKNLKIFLSFFLVIICDQFGMSGVSAQQNKILAVTHQTVIPANVAAKEQQTDSLQRVNDKIINAVDKRSDSILNALRDLQKQFAARPVKIVYRVKIIHDTIPAEENEYLPNTVYVPIQVHDTVIIKERFRLFNKKHKN